MAETLQSHKPICPEHQQRQREDEQSEGGENLDHCVDLKIGWRYYREPRRNPVGSVFIFDIAVAKLTVSNELELMAAYFI